MGVPAGPWHIDDLLTFTVTTRNVSTGAAADADAVPAYRVYEDETGTAILTGNMAKLDDASTIGFYSEQLTLSAANGFENGKSYAIYVSATVDSVAGAQDFNFKVDVPDVNIVTAAGTAWASGAITAAVIATGAIDADAIAANAIGSSEIADGAITAAKFAAGAIDATAIANGAIDAATFAANALDAVWSTAARTLTAGTNIQLPSNGLANITAWTVDITGNVTGNLSGSVGSVSGAVGSVTGAVGSITGNVGGNVTGSVGSLAAQAKADVNAEVVDVLTVDTFAQPGQEAPAATQSLKNMLAYVYKFLRNKVTQSATTFSVFADDGTTVDQKATVSEAAGTLTRGEIVSGP